MRAHGFTVLFLLIPLLAIRTTPAAAATEYVKNGSFSEGDFKANSGFDHIVIFRPNVSGPAPTSWAPEIGEVAWVEGGNQFIPADAGEKFLDLTGTDDTLPFKGVSQTLRLLERGHTYQVSLRLGTYPNSDRPEFAGPVAVEVRIETGTIVTNLCQSNPPLDPNNKKVQFEPCTFKFVANAPETVIHIRGAAGQKFIGIDDVSVTYVSPIPGWVRQFVKAEVIILLLGLIVLLWLLFGRRRIVRDVERG